MPTPPDLSGLTPEAKRRLLEELLAKRPSSPPEEEGPRAVSRQGLLPLSSAQERVCFLAQYEGATTNGRLTALRMRGPLDEAALAKAFDEALRRNEVLRSTVQSRDGRLWQRVEPPFALELARADLSALPEAEREAEYRRRARVEEFHDFALEQGPLLRLTLLRLGAEEHVLLLTVAAVVLDGADSLTLLLAEVAALYGAFAAQKPSPLPEPELQFSDFAAWEASALKSPGLAPHVDSWRRKLEGAPTVTELPYDHRPGNPTRGWLLRPAPRAAVEALRKLSRAHNATLYMALQAAFAALLQRCTGQTELLLGVTTDGRPHPRVKRMIGCFYNLAVARLDASGDPDFLALLSRARAATLEMLPHAHVPFERVVEAVKPPRAAGMHPLVQVTVTQMRGLVSDVPWPGLRVRHELFNDGFTLESLHLKLIEQEDGGLDTLLEYREDLFERVTAERLLACYHALLEAVAARPETKLSALPLLPPALRAQVVTEWNRTDADIPRVPYVALFEAQVARTPDAVAVTHGAESLTYRELNARANRWAHALIARGVGTDTLVSLLDERGTRLLTALLAVFKAGGGYLPLDPRHPAARYRQVLEQARCRLVLSAAALRPRLEEAVAALPEGARPEVLDFAALPETGDDSNPPLRGLPETLSYVLFTSGSTGAPKGAMLHQLGMVNHLLAKVRDLALTEKDVIAQTASQCFDISVFQSLTALLVGGRTLVLGDEISREARPLLSALEQHRVTIAEVVPSMLRALLDEVDAAGESKPALSALRWMIPTGEALPPATCVRWFQHYPSVPLANVCGPTECHDNVTHHFLRAPPESVHTPIGRPIPNARAYVLDAHLQPVPPGVVGELYVGGLIVGRGYLGRPDLTAERYLPDPFSPTPGGRLYRTGDQARLLSDGTVEYLGRLDFQVKIRGFRVELGEIEHALRAQPGVKDAVVLAREDTPGLKRLAAYVVAKDAPLSAEGLREALARALPDYMVPSAFVALPALPLNANGKVDRKQLPAPDASEAEAPRDATPPRDAVEERLARTWAELLGVESLGVHEDLFALGAQSLMAMRLGLLVRQSLGVELSVRDIFTHPTVALLAAHLRPALGAPPPPPPAPGAARS